MTTYRCTSPVGWVTSTRRISRPSVRNWTRQSLTHRFTYHGSPSIVDKVRFLDSLDVLSVPTDYEDPKGLFILESLAAGVPVVQPDHGAFGELIESTGGGVAGATWRHR